MFGKISVLHCQPGLFSLVLRVPVWSTSWATVTMSLSLWFVSIWWHCILAQRPVISSVFLWMLSLELGVGVGVVVFVAILNCREREEKT